VHLRLDEPCGIVQISVFSIELVCGPLQFSHAIDCVPLVPLGYALLAFELSFTFQGFEMIGTFHVDKNLKRPEFDENFSKP
jgi:hypothetical protein